MPPPIIAARLGPTALALSQEREDIRVGAASRRYRLQQAAEHQRRMRQIAEQGEANNELFTGIPGRVEDWRQSMGAAANDPGAGVRPEVSPETMASTNTGPVGGPLEERKARLEQALRKQRLKEATEARRGRSPVPEVAPRMAPNLLEEITGRHDQNRDIMASVAPPLSDYDEMKPGRVKTFADQAANTALFGQGDRIRALPALIPGGKTYDERRQEVRDEFAEQRETHPVTSGAGALAGFLAPGGAVFKGVNSLARPLVAGATRLAPMLGFGAKVGAGAAAGAADAALYGSTVQAENDAQDRGEGSPDLKTRLQTGASMAPIGAAFGGVVPAAAPLVRPIGRAVGGAAAGVSDAAKKTANKLLGTSLKPEAVARHTEKVGAEAARRTLERSGIVTIEDFLKRAAKYGDKPVVAGELGQDALNSLVALTRAKGTTGEKAMAVLEDRIAGLPGRMLKDLADETGLPPEAIIGHIDGMVAAGRSRAAPAYEAAVAAPFKTSERLLEILKAPAAKRAINIAKQRMENEGYASGLGQGATPELRLYDEAKRALDEEIRQLQTQGRSINDVEAVRAALVRELDEIVPGLYSAARDAGGDAPRILDAFAEGQRAMSGRHMADDVERQVADLIGEPLTAYQSGVVRNIVKEVENGTLTPKRVRTTAFQKKLRSVFGDPAADGLIRKFGLEAELSQKGARWNPNVGSVTSQAQMGGPSKAGDEALRMAANIASGNKIGAFVQMANWMRRQGYSEKQMDALGDILLSSPEEAAKRLFPNATPKPGSIPPPVLPAGRVRENPPRKVTPPSANALMRLSAGDLEHEAIGGLAGGTAGMVAPAEDNQQRGFNALLGMGVGAGIGRYTKGAPILREQSNAGFPMPSGFRGRTEREFDPRDLVMNYNDKASHRDIGLDLGLDPDKTNVKQTASNLLTNTRKTVQEAQKSGRLDDLAKQWNLSLDELESFLVPRVQAGQAESFYAKVADIVESINKTGDTIGIPALVSRLKAAGFETTEGSLKARLSQARTGNKADQAISEEMQARIRNLKFPRGRQAPTMEAAPEAGGAALGAGVGGFTDEDGFSFENDFDSGQAAAGAVLGAVGGNMLRRGGERGAVGGLSKGEQMLANGDVLMNPSRSDLARILKSQEGMGGDKVVRLLRDPATQEVYAFDGSVHTHDDITRAFGIDPKKMHRGWAHTADISTAKWETGEGLPANTLDKKMRSEMLKGRDAKEAFMDLTPEEVAEDLRAIGATGPGKSMNDYPHRRKLAMDGVRQEQSTTVGPGAGVRPAGVSYEGPHDSRVYVSTGSDTPSLFFNSPPRNALTNAQSSEMFEKAFAVMEREAIRNGHDIIRISGMGDGHKALYRGAIERLGAPQGYTAAITKSRGRREGAPEQRILLLRNDVYAERAAQGEFGPDEWIIIPSKRGPKEVPEWRRQTGQFAFPALMAGGAYTAQKEEAPPSLAALLRSSGADSNRR